MLTEKKIYFPRLIDYWEKTNIKPINSIKCKFNYDGLSITENQLALISNIAEFKIFVRKNNNQWIITDYEKDIMKTIAFVTGTYLEEFSGSGVKLMVNEINKNLKLRVAPPMLYLKDDVYNELLYLVVGAKEDCGIVKEFILIDVDNKTYLEISLEELKKKIKDNWKWIMLNSPSLAKPVFRDGSELIRLSLVTNAKRFLNTHNSFGGGAYFGNAALDFFISKYNSNVSVISDLKIGPSYGREFIIEGLERLEVFNKFDLAKRNFNESKEMWRFFNTTLNCLNEENAKNDLVNILEDIKKLECEAFKDILYKCLY